MIFSFLSLFASLVCIDHCVFIYLPFKIVVDVIQNADPSAQAMYNIVAGGESNADQLHNTQKKSALRDFLSSWNEDEEEDNDHSLSKKLAHSYALAGHGYNHNPSHSFNLSGHAHASHIVSSKSSARFESSHKPIENVPVIVPPIQPMHPSAQVPPNHLQSSIVSTPYAAGIQVPVPVPAIPHIPPKIHVGISVDNGTQNLPDIIIDIEKTKPTGEGECFERTNGK